MNALHVVVPHGIDDPHRPSGGNIYDRRICNGLRDCGWVVHEHAIPGQWPAADESSRQHLADAIAGVPHGGILLIDGLIASASADVLLPHAGRVNQVVLLHMPLGGDEQVAAATREQERSVVSSATAVIATSHWTRRWLLDAYDVVPSRVHVVEPGVEPAALTGSAADGGRLLCVAAVMPHKGQDILVAALATLVERSWTCRLVGSLDRDPDFVARLREQALAAGIADRLSFDGPLIGLELDTAYASADLLVLASRAETYGMVVTESLARGVPVVATDVGGVPTALGAGADGYPPGLLVPTADPAALAVALRQWLDDPRLRARLRRGAVDRRSTLVGWPEAAAQLSDVLRGVAA